MQPKNISNIRFSACEDSKYIKFKRMLFTENGKERSWDIIEAHDSVAALLYHTQKDAFVIVKQFRPAVFLKERNRNTEHLKTEIGYTFELCAGITDKDKPLNVIMQEEILEECGYNIPLENITQIAEFYSSVGFAGSKQTLFFATLDESYRQNLGGGVDDENIEVVFIPKAEAYDFILDSAFPKTSGIMFAFLWFFRNKI
ncbi:NUDIX hydrolase [Helicobacter turcicus]|uniref:NUDIX hydrolase n=1 Tax=Helicobacter turcicus TaxID=2867412 RepID=A0ABS7JNE8_9HELI|nr:NUDIX hydrolase [Helicobacter turcicus]MBX7490898.1 NUDIX hydrolase [Helicobacter turcicus]MBX7545752.1 NUDIX hydrolase [Helicobacter turcicus]